MRQYTAGGPDCSLGKILYTRNKRLVRKAIYKGSGEEHARPHCIMILGVFSIINSKARWEAVLLIF